MRLTFTTCRSPFIIGRLSNVRVVQVAQPSFFLTVNYSYLFKNSLDFHEKNGHCSFGNSEISPTITNQKHVGKQRGVEEKDWFIWEFLKAVLKELIAVQTRPSYVPNKPRFYTHGKKIKKKNNTPMTANHAEGIHSECTLSCEDLRASLISKWCSINQAWWIL